MNKMIVRVFFKALILLSLFTNLLVADDILELGLDKLDGRIECMFELPIGETLYEFNFFIGKKPVRSGYDQLLKSFLWRTIDIGKNLAFFLSSVFLISATERALDNREKIVDFGCILIIRFLFHLFYEASIGSAVFGVLSYLIDIIALSIVVEKLDESSFARHMSIVMGLLYRCEIVKLICCGLPKLLGDLYRLFAYLLYDNRVLSDCSPFYKLITGRKKPVKQLNYSLQDFLEKASPVYANRHNLQKSMVKICELTIALIPSQNKLHEFLADTSLVYKWAVNKA